MATKLSKSFLEAAVTRITPADFIKSPAYRCGDKNEVLHFNPKDEEEWLKYLAKLAETGNSNIIEAKEAFRRKKADKTA
ncbi:MAG: hypothetical protein LBU87_01665 [Lactobacillales bacterium]|jgi:hypothetical protein|nr:hypothetical protein [Lactobacillales bacterium]